MGLQANVLEISCFIDMIWLTRCPKVTEYQIFNLFRQVLSIFVAVWTDMGNVKRLTQLMF